MSNRTVVLAVAVTVASLVSARASLCMAEQPPTANTSVSLADTSLYDLQGLTLEGEEVAFGAWRGKVALVVNVASKCGLTPQYAGLEKLYRELAPRGFVILAFPSNDFRNQEPGSAEEIRTFCQQNYGVTFPLFAKVVVTGEEKCEVYRFLTRDHAEPSWNFTKYLVDRAGRVLERFEPATKPDDPALREAIEKALTG